MLTEEDIRRCWTARTKFELGGKKYVEGDHLEIDGKVLDKLRRSRMVEPRKYDVAAIIKEALSGVDREALREEIRSEVVTEFGEEVGKEMAELRRRADEAEAKSEAARQAVSAIIESRDAANEWAEKAKAEIDKVRADLKAVTLEKTQFLEAFERSVQDVADLKADLEKARAELDAAKAEGSGSKANKKKT